MRGKLHSIRVTSRTNKARLQRLDCPLSFTEECAVVPGLICNLGLTGVQAPPDCPLRTGPMTIRLDRVSDLEWHRISRQERAIDSARRARNEEREPLRGTFA